MTMSFMNMLWSIEPRMGFGLDIESCSSRPVWTTSLSDDNIEAMEFDGLVLCIPFFIITIGNVWRTDSDE